jgi:glycosyltransferase involved in cell wall biosynthesis
LAQRPAPFHFRHEIVTVHDVFPLTGTKYSSSSFQQRFSRLLLEAVARASAIITPSEYTARQLLSQTDVRSEKVRVIPWGVAAPIHKLGSEERAREREALAGAGNCIVLAVGAIQTRKNTSNLVRALTYLPSEYKLVLAGSEGYGAEAVDEVVRREHLSSRVKKLGYVTDQQLAVLYQSADVLAFPSWEEGSGLPVLEAMSYSLPVVAARTSCLPEIAGDAALYVDPADPREIAEKIRIATEDSATRSALIDKGLNRARGFTWRQTAEATLRVYEEVFAGKSAAQT